MLCQLPLDIVHADCLYAELRGVFKTVVENFVSIDSGMETINYWVIEWLLYI